MNYFINTSICLNKKWKVWPCIISRITFGYDQIVKIWISLDVVANFEQNSAKK